MSRKATTTRTLVRMYDRAIDWTPGTGTSDTWPESRDDAELVLRPGMTPTRFTVTQLSTSLYEWTMEAPSAEGRCFRAFRAGVRRVDRPGVGPWTPANVDAREYRSMTEDEAEEFPIPDRLEIGGLIIEWTVLPPDCEGGYSRRPTSLHAWAAVQRSFLTAERRRRTPAPTPSESAATSEG